MTDDPEYLTPEEIADRLRLSVRTIYTCIRQGELIALKVRGKYRVLRADYDTWVKELTHNEGD